MDNPTNGTTNGAAERPRNLPPLKRKKPGGRAPGFTLPSGIGQLIQDCLEGHCLLKIGVIIGAGENSK